MWLGEVFAKLGCQAVPALHCTEAIGLAAQLHAPVQIVVVNPELHGSGQLVGELKQTNPNLRVVLIRNSGANGSEHGAHADLLAASAILERPAPWDSISLREWLAKVRKVLT